MIELTKDECARAALEYSAEQFEVGVRFAYEQKVRR